MDTRVIPDAITSGQLAGAALDVLDQEPPMADDPLLLAWRDPSHPAYDRVIINPHSAFYSEEGLLDMRRRGAEACRRALLGLSLSNIVNGVEQFSIASRLAVFIMALGFLLAPSARSESLIPSVCSGCHNAQNAMGNLDLAALPPRFEDRTLRDRWIRVHDRVAKGEMPPKGVPFPAAQRAEMLSRLGREIAEADRAEVLRDGRGAMRRLNRDEYEQNLRDVLQLPDLDIRDMLPEDREGHRFNKAAETLDMSRVQLSAYLDVAEVALREAVATELPPPVSKFRAIGTALFPDKSTFGGREAMFFARNNKAIEAKQLGAVNDDPSIEMALFRSAHWPYFGYRVADRVSQFLVRHVQGKGPQDGNSVFFRTILFKLFNRIETWQLLESAVGKICPESYDFRAFDRVLSDEMSKGRPIYSAAYIMPSGGGEGTRKHQMHLRLLETMMKNDLPARLAESRSMQQAFELIRAYPTIGDFLAYQYVTDLNYSAVLDFSEMDFVVPGPGARSGIQKCFADRGSYSEADLIRWMVEHQQEEFSKRGIEFQTLWGRPLQLIDCQNLFCEVDKYARVHHPDVSGLSSRVRIKQEYRYNPEPLEYWLPPKWELNGRIAAWREAQFPTPQASPATIHITNPA